MPKVVDRVCFLWRLCRSLCQIKHTLCVCLIIVHPFGSHVAPELNHYDYCKRNGRRIIFFYLNLNSFYFIFCFSFDNRRNKFWWGCSLCVRRARGHWSASLKSNFVGFHIVRFGIVFVWIRIEVKLQRNDWCRWINEENNIKIDIVWSQLSDRIPQKLVRCSNTTSYPS